MFSYPYGSHNEAVERVAAEEGIVAAVTCIDGHNQLGVTSPLRLRRTNISTRSTDVVFRARLNPFMAYLDLWRHRGERVHILGETA